MVHENQEKCHQLCQIYESSRKSGFLQSHFLISYGQKVAKKSASVLGISVQKNASWLFILSCGYLFTFFSAISPVALIVVVGYANKKLCDK